MHKKNKNVGLHATKITILRQVSNKLMRIMLKKECRVVFNIQLNARNIITIGFAFDVRQ